MASFSITYHSPSRETAILPSIFQLNDPQHTDWITPEGWSARDAKEAFEARYPGSVVLRCDDIGNPNGNLL
jgi:hypothetical protein